MLKKVMVHISKLFPFLFALSLFFKPFGIYIAEIDLYLSEVFTPSVFVILSFLWMFYLPYRKSCKGTSVVTFLFYLIPIELMLLLVFAQYHFVISVAMLALTVVISIVFRVYLHHDQDDSIHPRQAKEVKKHMGRRFFVLVCSLLLAIPGLFSLFVFRLQKPVYQAVQDEAALAAAPREDDADPTLSEEVLQKLNEDYWKNTTIIEKLSLLQEISDYETAKLGCPPVIVRATKLNELTQGLYVHGKQRIYIDVSHLCRERLPDVIGTTLHETFHSYQYYIVQQIDWNSELAKTAYYQEAASWKSNYDHYVSGYVDVEGYLKQPLESSAREFALEELNQLQKFLPSDQQKS